MTDNIILTLPSSFVKEMILPPDTIREELPMNWHSACINGVTSPQPKYAGYQVLTGTNVKNFSGNNKYPPITPKMTWTRISDMQLVIPDSLNLFNLLILYINRAIL